VSTKMIELFRRPTDPKDNFDVYIPPITALIGGVIAASYAGFAEVPNVAGAGAAVACICSIANLSSQKTARWGNFIGMVGVATGLVATLGMIYVSVASASITGPQAINPEASGMRAVAPMFALIILLIGAGALVGLFAASKVSPTELPQTVAAFHSLVGK
jgi:H+-translocating NAD(P) transhydrogenase